MASAASSGLGICCRPNSRLVISITWCLADGQQDDPSCLGNTDTGGNVLTEKQLFNGNHIGLCHFQQLFRILIDDLQPGRKVHAGGGGDGTAVQKLKVITVTFHQTKADDAVTGVDS